nr:PREDICTED: uncharacterized protein LOC108195753 [Daucus carota subsp. sativus]
MGLATIGLVEENTKEKVIYGKPVFPQFVSFPPTPVSVTVVSRHSTIMPVNRIQDELEKWNGWIANCELVKRVALGIAWVPGYIWKNLGFATARSEMRQTGEDTNISIPSSNFEVPDPNVGWERN